MLVPETLCSHGECWVQVLDERLSYAVEHCTTYDNLPNAGRFSRTHSKDDEVVRCLTDCSLDVSQVRGACMCMVNKRWLPCSLACRGLW